MATRPPTRRTTLTRTAHPRYRALRLIRTAALVLFVCAGAAAGALLVTTPDVSALAHAQPESTAFIDLRRTEAVAAGKRFHLRWTYKPLKRISPYLQYAVVHAEDGAFWTHEGVDWNATEQALRKNLEQRKMAVGGSTITQQLAKNLYLSPARNPIRKLREWWIASRLESELEKTRILELYLNVAEWGDGVFGAEAAARRWFRTSAENLSPAQAARLAVALPNPFRRGATARSRFLDKKAARLVRGMARDGLINKAVRDQALADLGLSP